MAGECIAKVSAVAKGPSLTEASVQCTILGDPLDAARVSPDDALEFEMDNVPTIVTNKNIASALKEFQAFLSRVHAAILCQHSMSLTAAELGNFLGMSQIMSGQVLQKGVELAP